MARTAITGEPTPSADAPSDLPARFFIATPADWIHADVSVDGPAAARRLLDSLPVDPGQHALKHQVGHELGRALTTARQQGAVMAAFWSRSLDGRAIGASLTVAIAPFGTASALADDGGVDLDRVMRTVAEAVERGEDGGEVGVIDLPAGPAVRLRKRQAADALGDAHETDVVQFFVPIPGRLNLLVMTFSTPTVELADALGELFDAMAASLRWRS